MFVPLYGWFGFIIKAVAYSIVYFVIIFAIGLNKGEKETVIKFFKRKFKKENRL